MGFHSKWAFPSLLLITCLLAGCRASAPVGDAVGQPSAGQPSQSQDARPAAPQPSADGEEIQASPEWFVCKQDADCTVEPGLCQAPVAVNVRFVPQFQAYRDYWNRTVDCAAPEPSGTASKAACVQNHCALRN